MINIDSNYQRVIPRDLFNEAKLGKCMGRLILRIHDCETPVHMSFEHNGNPFDIGLGDDGNLHIKNIRDGEFTSEFANFCKSL